MSLARFSVRQVVLMNLLFIILILAGIVVMQRLPVEVYPDVSMDMASITTMWLGASSEEIERLVTSKIEDEIEDVRSTDRVVSISQPDISVITVKFREDISREELEAAFGELQIRLDRVTDLPENAEEPALERMTTDEVMPLLQVAVVNRGDVDERICRRVAEDLKDELRVLPGVSRLRIVGMREREVHIKVDKEGLERHDVSLQNIADILAARNINMPAGYLKVGSSEITLRSIGEVDDPQRLGDVNIVRSATGAHVKLSDIAEIQEDFERAVWGARVDGKPAIMLYVAKDRAANSLEVRQAIGDRIAKYQDALDVDGVGLEIQGDGTAIIASRLAVLKSNMLVGIILVLVVLWVAMGFRIAMLAIVGIPFSFLCAVIFMYLIGVSLNAVSIFSLVLVSGMIVDDAIVVLENIYRHVQDGLSIKDAVIFGTEEVMWPVASSTMTTLAAFIPLLVMTGMLGEFFSIVPKTVTVALTASLFECLLILPVHYLDWGPRAPRLEHVAESRSRHAVHFFARIGDAMRRAYDAVLGQTLAYRALIPLVVLGFGIFIWQAQRTLVVEMFPSDFPTFVVDFHAKAGSSLEATDKAVGQFSPILNDMMPEQVERFSTAIGVMFNDDNQRIMRPDIAQMWVDVNPGSHRHVDPEEILQEVRTRLNGYLEAHPNCGIDHLRVWPIRNGPPVGKPVAIRVEHPDYDSARQVVDRIKERLNAMPGVTDVTDNLQLGNRELLLHVDDAKASEYGLTFYDVATALRGAKDGLVVGIFKDTEHDEDLDIKVRYADQYIQDLDQLTDIDIVSPVTGWSVKLHQVADLTFQQSYTNRYHYDTKRAVEITADVDNETADARIVNEAIMAEFGPLSDGDDKLTIVTGGQFAETRDSFRSLKQSAMIALMLMYLILASQFRNYLQPAVVMVAVVFGVMGMVLGLVLYGYPFSVVTGIAMVGLCGVVVNDAIVLVDFINNEQRAGTPLFDAVRIACQRRMRPILLTTITTVAGLAPMAFGAGGYSKVWSPFAMSMCWGLVIATLLTLLAVPALYCIAEETRMYILRLFGRDGDRRADAAPPASPAAD